MSMRFAQILCCLAITASAQIGPSPEGNWTSNLKFFENNNYDRLELHLAGTKLTGKLSGDVFEGTFQNGKLEGVVKSLHLQGHLSGNRIEGTATNVKYNEQYKWEATRNSPATKAPSRTHTFEPTEFHHFFSAAIPPALHVNPGDTVNTWSVDAGGTDSKGVRRTSGGNPLTGPFYIEGALPGDTLAVHFTRIRLNRDSAISSPLIVESALNTGYVRARKPPENYSADWKLDRESGFASLQQPTEKMKNYRVPLAPMLGCVGVAPPGGAQYRSGYLASFGGNMDYNQLREGITVYLPVYTPGALLFVGDGHAAQGAGELTGNALETSMDISFTVDLEPGASLPDPRMENESSLMASGINGSLDKAFRDATTNLAQWLEKRYSLNPAEVSSVLGTAMVYDIAEVVDPQVHVVAKVPKSVLQSLGSSGR